MAKILRRFWWLGKHGRSARRRWIHSEYWRFGQEERNRIFLSIARFMHINRPMTGYYFEFGCNGANTIKLAWNNFRHLFDFHYVGFDSFEGLPEIAEIDKQEIWRKGKLAYEESVYTRIALAHGIPVNRFRTVKGFYENTLNGDLRTQLSPMKAAVVYIDCDLYMSTVPILEWIIDFLQRGTIIVFDDWFCFHGDPERGERLAWKEFCARHPELIFEDFVATNEAKSFIFIGSKSTG